MRPDSDDITWIERAREGDSDARSAVADSLRPRLERMAAHYARRCGEDADDLLQEAWVGLLDALPGIDTGIGCPRQYLLRRAKWRLLDHVKRSRLRRCAPLEEEWLPHGEFGEHDALHRASAREFIRQLTPAQRQIVDRLLEGKTWREVGTELGCTSANVAYHMRQIRRLYAAWSGEMPALSRRVKTL